MPGCRNLIQRFYRVLGDFLSPVQIAKRGCQNLAFEVPVCEHKVSARFSELVTACDFANIRSYFRTVRMQSLPGCFDQEIGFSRRRVAKHFLLCFLYGPEENDVCKRKSHRNCFVDILRKCHATASNCSFRRGRQYRKQSDGSDSEHAC